MSCHSDLSWRYISDTLLYPFTLYSIGVNCPDPECVTGAYSSYGDMITENQAPGWADGQPDFAIGQCGYTKKNKETYAYDKPYVQAMDHCSVKRSFVCERMAAPRGSFHCFSGGYVDMGNLCNRRRDCPDGSDEMDCRKFYIKYSYHVLYLFGYKKITKSFL